MVAILNKKKHVLLQHDDLKARHRQIRDSIPQSLSLRTHRALSWLDRAEQENNDADARFVFLWIAFNAAYAVELRDRVDFSERRLFVGLFRKLLSVDRDGAIYDLIWHNFPNSIRLLIDNQYVFQPYWDHVNGKLTEQEWTEKFRLSQNAANRALGRMNTEKVMGIAFSRLYVLRNQMVHGGSTWNSSINRSQVNDGARFLGQVVPLMIHLMMENADVDWGEPCYPAM